MMRPWVIVSMVVIAVCASSAFAVSASCTMQNASAPSSRATIVTSHKALCTCQIISTLPISILMRLAKQALSVPMRAMKAEVGSAFFGSFLYQPTRLMVPAPSRNKAIIHHQSVVVGNNPRFSSPNIYGTVVYTTPSISGAYTVVGTNCINGAIVYTPPIAKTTIKIYILFDHAMLLCSVMANKALSSGSTAFQCCRK